MGLAESKHATPHGGGALTGAGGGGAPTGASGAPTGASGGGAPTGASGGLDTVNCRADEDGALKFAAMVAAVETATTPRDLQAIVKDVTVADVARLSPEQAKHAFDTLSAALVVVDPATTDAKVKVFRTLASGGVNPAILRLLVARVVRLHAASGYKPVADMTKSIQNLLAARRDCGKIGGGGGAGGAGGGGGGVEGAGGAGGGKKVSGRYLRGRLAPSAVMSSYAFAVKRGAKTAAEASEGAARDSHGNLVGEAYDLAKPKALIGTSVMVFVGTYELEDLVCAGGPSPVFQKTFIDKGIKCTKCVLRRTCTADRVAPSALCAELALQTVLHQLRFAPNLHCRPCCTADRVALALNAHDACCTAYGALLVREILLYCDLFNNMRAQ